MPKTLGLVALLVLGVVLLLNPLTDILGTTAVEPTAAAPSPTTAVTKGEPPLDDEPEPPPSTIQEAPTTSEAPAPSTVATGRAVATRFGDFQVEIEVENGVLVDIVTLQEPGDRRSLRINQTALPRYEEAAIESQSANIDVISGATVTWQAYTVSLQAALDAVGI
jgi:uncharacterized protein with FMN-binding domain